MPAITHTIDKALDFLTGDCGKSPAASGRSLTPSQGDLGSRPDRLRRRQQRAPWPDREDPTTGQGVPIAKPARGPLNRDDAFAACTDAAMRCVPPLNDHQRARPAPTGNDLPRVVRS